MHTAIGIWILAFSLIICIGEPEINIVLTGVMGNGKSEACNFFFWEEVFRSEMGFSPVTSDADFHVRLEEN